MNNPKLARYLQRKAKAIYPLPLKGIRITFDFVDGKSSEHPVWIGEPVQEKPRDSKKKLLDAAPANNQEGVVAKRLISDAGLGYNHWSRKQIRELVSDGELIQEHDKYRKAK